MTDPTRPTRPALTCDDVRELSAPFVLGALDEDEAEAVRAHLATCVESHDELIELASVLPILSESVPIVEPPADLKARLMAAAASEFRQATAGTNEVPSVSADRPSDQTVPFPSAAEREDRRAGQSAQRGMSAGSSTSARRGTWLVRIAAVLAIGLLGGWNLLLQGELGVARTYERNVAAVLGLAGQPGSLTAILTPESGRGAGLAAVAADGSVTLAMRDLPATTGGEVYSAWVISAAGVPAALGSFRVGSTGTAYLEAGGPVTEAGSVLAVTRERGPGATTPTMPVVSSGTTSAAG
ncbi:MAG: anti-sigma factor [Chloroflexi bacterium]|nr:anti-sigma factor [Chloroflexota bacterium]